MCISINMHEASDDKGWFVANIRFDGHWQNFSIRLEGDRDHEEVSLANGVSDRAYEEAEDHIKKAMQIVMNTLVRCSKDEDGRVLDEHCHAVNEIGKFLDWNIFRPEEFQMST